MRNLFKKLFIPSGQKTEVIAYQSWAVRWTSWRLTDYGTGYEKPQVEIFPSEEDANKFAIQLRDAWRLLKCSGGGISVTIEANQTKLATV